MKTSLCFILFLFLNHHLSAQNNIQIDLDLEKCLQKDETTAGQRNCIGVAYKNWDNELNKYYKLLMQKLPKNAAAELKVSQLNWLVFRDAEFEFNSTFYFKVKEGTMFYVIADDSKMQLLKNRVVQLENYYEQIDY